MPLFPGSFSSPSTAPSGALRRCVESCRCLADSRRKRKADKLGLQCPKVCLDYEEAAWSLGISKSKLYRLVSEGRLPCVVIDGNTVLRLDDLETFAVKHTIVKGQT